MPPAKVRLVTIRRENLPSVIELTGTIRPAQRAQLAARLMGAIEEMPVALGQHVRAGELVVRISAAEISARLVQAQAQLNAVRRDLERERDLLAKNASTADMVRGLEDRFVGAQAGVREAEAMLGYATILAPFDGVVARKSASLGDLASPGLPLLELEGTSDFQVEVAVPDSLVPALLPGAKILIDPAPAAPFTGTLAELSSAADAGARTVLAKITVPTGIHARSGQFVRAQLPGAPTPALWAPASAVSTIGQLERVFVCGAGDRAVLRLIKTGTVRGDRIEILSGLDDGERIVELPAATLREGQPLTMLP
jgi:RND family efflux transporter MFP subunit